MSPPQTLHTTFDDGNTVPLDLNFTYARVQKATARNIHGNAPEYLALAPE